MSDGPIIQEQGVQVQEPRTYTYCVKCGRHFRHPKPTQYGPVCARRMREQKKREAERKAEADA